MFQAQFEKTFSGWRAAARGFLLAKISPDEIHWEEDQPTLFVTSNFVPPLHSENLTVNSDFMGMAESVSYARDDDRWALLYRVLFRLQFENRRLLSLSIDPDVLRVQLLAKSVRRDIHKMHAFVRFKKVMFEGDEIFQAWHRSEHLIVKAATPFFARRFGDRRWSIFTPEESAHWDLRDLRFGPGMEQNLFQACDEWDEIWKEYYKSIFNPARIKIKAMKLEMPRKYWASMPETSLIHELVRSAPERLQNMAANHNTAAQVEKHFSIDDLRVQARGCTACPLFSRATQTVFGAGPEGAKIMIVGEQPGEQEDLAGVPFVGPAGGILEQALIEAGLRREDVYLTNSVKHFKWAPRGKTRLHQKPSGGEVHACKPWLDAEIARIKPQVIVALGATAGTAILGRLPKIASERGIALLNLAVAPAVILSWHPAAILRSSREAEASERSAQLIEDLKLAKRMVRSELHEDKHGGKKHPHEISLETQK